MPSAGHNVCHRLYKAARLGREHLPSLVVTAAETLAIRSDAVPGLARRAGGTGPAMIIMFTIWHNVAVGAQGQHTAMIDGYQPGDPVVRVFTYLAGSAGRAPEAMAEVAFAICDGHPAMSAARRCLAATTHVGRSVPPP